MNSPVISSAIAEAKVASQLSWQPPPVTKCGECEYAEHDWQTCELDPASKHRPYDAATSTIIYIQNKDGITESCPMWQQQNKETLCNAADATVK